MTQKTRPNAYLLKEEIQRRKEQGKYRHAVCTTLYALLIVAAVAVLIAMLWLPVLQVTGTSMEPTLASGQILLAGKNSTTKTGDLIAFYYNNKILIKRVIGTEGNQIDIRSDGTVLVNGNILDEPYVSEKSLGECDLTFPYQVPDGKIFVLGDHRRTSIDSRSNTVGCIAEEYIVGKILFRIWPLDVIERLS